jgi:broad specificity phosphatase PhoE
MWPLILALVAAFIIWIVSVIFNRLKRRFDDKFMLRSEVDKMFISEPEYNWHTIMERTENAKVRIYILQTWLPDYYHELKHWKIALKKNTDLKFHVLLLDEKLIEYRKKYRPPVEEKLVENVSKFELLKKEFNTLANARIEYKFYLCLPFGPIYIIDDDIYFGLYLSDGDSMEGPVFKFNANSKLGQMIMSSWENMWVKASNNSGSLGIIPIISNDKVKWNELINVTGKFQYLKKIKILTKDEVATNPNIVNICVLRHTETDLNTSGIIAGQLDVSINSVGIQNAISVGKKIQHFNWNQVYTSSLKRCIDTIEFALPKLPEKIIVKLDKLNERAMGDAQGSLKNEYKNLISYQGDESLYAKDPKGESYADVLYRLLSFFKDLDEHIQKGERILICTHETPIRIMLMIFGGFEYKAAFSENIENGEIIYFSYSD